MPKKRLNFDMETPDGRLALVYKADQNRRFSIANYVLLSAIPPVWLAPYFVPPEFLFYTYSAIFLPTLIAFRDSIRGVRAKKSEVAQIDLYENGEQLLVRTYDGVLHKLDIYHNDKHEYKENKDKSLVFIMENFGRKYSI